MRAFVPFGLCAARVLRHFVKRTFCVRRLWLRLYCVGHTCIVSRCTVLRRVRLLHGGCSIAVLRVPLSRLLCHNTCSSLHLCLLAHLPWCCSNITHHTDTHRAVALAICRTCMLPWRVGRFPPQYQHFCLHLTQDIRLFCCEERQH